MVTDLIGGQVDFGTAALPSVQQHIEVRRAARHRRGRRAAHAGRAGHPDHRRAGPAELRGRSLVRRARAEGHGGGRRASACTTRSSPRSPTRRSRRRWPSRATPSTSAPPEQGAGVLPQREGQVRQAGEEGRHRAAVSDVSASRCASRRASCSSAPTRRGCARSWPGDASRRAQAGAAARRRLDRRDLAAAGDGALRCHARPLSVHRLQGRRRAADRRATRCATPASRWWWRAPLRQGQLARAQRGRRAVGRRAAGDRRELRAHLPPERRQPRPADHHRLRPRRAHRSAARRSRSTNCSPGRDALAAAIVRAGGLLAYGQGPARRGAAGRGRAARPATLFEKIVDRHALPRRHAVAARRPGRLRARRPALHPRVLHRHVRAPAGPARSATRWRCTSPASIVCFEDHLSYVHRSPVHVAQGLVGGVRGCRARTARSSRATA